MVVMRDSSNYMSHGGETVKTLTRGHTALLCGFFFPAGRPSAEIFLFSLSPMLSLLYPTASHWWARAGGTVLFISWGQAEEPTGYEPDFFHGFYSGFTRQ